MALLTADDLRVVGSYPLNQAVSIPSNSPITIYFSQPLDELTVISENFILSKFRTGDLVNFTLTYDRAKFAVTITPDEDLESSTDYLLVVIGDPEWTSDSNRNPYGVVSYTSVVMPYNWYVSFKTEIGYLGQVSLSSPADLSSNPQPINLTWEPIYYSGSPSSSITYEVDVSQYENFKTSDYHTFTTETTISPTPIIEGVTYYWRIRGGFSGMNPFSGIISGATGTIDVNGPWSYKQQFYAGYFTAGAIDGSVITEDPYDQVTSFTLVKSKPKDGQYDHNIDRYSIEVWMSNPVSATNIQGLFYSGAIATGTINSGLSGLWILSGTDSSGTWSGEYDYSLLFYSGLVGITGSDSWNWTGDSGLWPDLSRNASGSWLDSGVSVPSLASYYFSGNSGSSLTFLSGVSGSSGTNGYISGLSGAGIISFEYTQQVILSGTLYPDNITLEGYALEVGGIDHGEVPLLVSISSTKIELNIP